MKILAVGDIHCKVWILDEVSKLVDKYDGVVFTGDFVDNWGSTAEDSISTLRKIKQLTDDYPWVLALIGNHDYAYILKKIQPRSSGYSPTTQLLLNSPENKDLKQWLLDRPTSIEIEKVTYSHAGIAAGWRHSSDEYAMWSDISPIWLRPYDAVYAKGPQVVGHTPVQTVTNLGDNIWAIDTFSTHRDGTPIGDHTVLEITNGKKFEVIKLNDD